jgi:hypothetical protein
MKHCVKFLLGLAALLYSLAGYAADNVCSWDKPGVNLYRGSVPDAVDKYTDMPQAVRNKLKARMERRQYDDIAVIRRDSIEGKQSHYANLRAMHFGQGQVCQSVTRSKWTAASEERGLVYCESGHCIIVPTVCRNVSRIDRKEGGLAMEPPGAGGGAPGPAPVAVAPPAAAEEPPAEEGQARAMGGGGATTFADGSGGGSGGAMAGPIIGGGGGGGGYLGGNTGSGGGGGIPGPSIPTPPPIIPPVTPPVPEPSTWLMLLAGGVLIGRKITARR